MKIWVINKQPDPLRAIDNNLNHESGLEEVIPEHKGSHESLLDFISTLLLTYQSTFSSIEQSQYSWTYVKHPLRHTFSCLYYIQSESFFIQQVH